MKSQSEVAQSCPALSDPMDCSLPGSSVHGIFQARVLEWGATEILFKPVLDIFKLKCIEVNFLFCLLSPSFLHYFSALIAPQSQN